jgi:hypothetical protein
VSLSSKTGIEYERNEKLVPSEDDYERPPKKMNPNILRQYDFDYDYFIENWGVSKEVAEKRKLCLDPYTKAECFPIFDLDGIFWGMVERLPPTDNRRSFYKYPRDFKKSDILLGEDKQSDEVWLVEGVRDLCSIESKVKGATAVALGTSKPSKTQLDRLRYYDMVNIALDNDESGRKGTEIVLNSLSLDSLQMVKYEGKDPHEAKEFEINPPYIRS